MSEGAPQVNEENAKKLWEMWFNEAAPILAKWMGPPVTFSPAVNPEVIENSKLADETT